jgi:hypothetical protein
MHNGTFGDNDTLSADVACLANADLLVILSDVDGLYDANPKDNPSASRISFVEAVTDDMLGSPPAQGSWLGTGGMATKITAMEKVTAHGITASLLMVQSRRFWSAFWIRTTSAHFSPPGKIIRKRTFERLCITGKIIFIILLSFAAAMSGCSSHDTEGTAVTLDNGEQVGTIVTIPADESGVSDPSESRSSSSSSLGDPPRVRERAMTLSLQGQRQLQMSMCSTITEPT